MTRPHTSLTLMAAQAVSEVPGSAVAPSIGPAGITRPRVPLLYVGYLAGLIVASILLILRPLM